jgi:hypothetical protein
MNPTQRLAPAVQLAPAFSYTLSPVTKIAQLIGSTPQGPNHRDDPYPYSINDTTRWDLCRGDLGSLMISQGVGYIAIGDNYSDCGNGKPGPKPPVWRSNALGIIPNPNNFVHGLHIARWFSHNGKTAAQVIPSAHDASNCQVTQAPHCEVTTIPTYSFAVHRHLFLAFMSVHHWDEGSWQVNYSSFAMSSNRARTWHVETRRIRWGQNSNFAQVAVAPDPKRRHLLFYGIPGGTLGQVELMRTDDSVSAVLTPHDHQYFVGARHGRPLWTRRIARARTVVQGLIGDPSVIYDKGLKRWIMTDLEGDSTLDIRIAANYWGLWSQPQVMATQGDYPGLYGAFMNPRFLTHKGRTIYFVMTQSGPYRVYWMRVSLTKSYRHGRYQTEPAHENGSWQAKR